MSVRTVVSWLLPGLCSSLALYGDHLWKQDHRPALLAALSPSALMPFTATALMGCGVWESTGTLQAHSASCSTGKGKNSSCKPVPVLNIPDATLGSYATVKPPSEDALFRSTVSQTKDGAPEEGYNNFLKSFNNYSVTAQLK